MPYSRQTSLTKRPPSTSLTILTVYDSLYLDFFMPSSVCLIIGRRTLMTHATILAEIYNTSAYLPSTPWSSCSTALAIRSRALCRISSHKGLLVATSGCGSACRLDLNSAYHSSVGCDLGGDQPTEYATSYICLDTPEITITQCQERLV